MGLDYIFTPIFYLFCPTHTVQTSFSLAHLIFPPLRIFSIRCTPSHLAAHLLLFFKQERSNLEAQSANHSHRAATGKFTAVTRRRRSIFLLHRYFQSPPSLIRSLPPLIRSPPPPIQSPLPSPPEVFFSSSKIPD
ncbi:unnamed protein product [Cuscuta epithymum]|uniref:Uncharacterized protein n=1 Tax=Cuscuta epithymum TaxID=186058 RepID=A0AAV0CFK1_9ASTE|nr:unnamed protein product [Cuscuta epithymum]